MLVVPIVGCGPPDLTINVNGSGSTTGAGIYNEDTEATISATPDPGWTFVNWTGDAVADPNSATTTITMDDDKTVTANFGHPVTTNNLTINIIGEGSTTGAGTYDEGTVVTITANPDYGYVFDGWTGDVVANPNSSTTTVTMDGDKTVTANFFYMC